MLVTMKQREQFSVSKSTGLRSACVGALALLLSACGSDEPQVAASVAPVKRAQVPDDPTAKMARAVTVNGATVPVNLKYEILTKPVVGMPVEIELAVMPSQSGDSMTVAFVGSAGLTLSADAAPPMNAVKAGQIERVKFSAQAQQATVFYVTVTATVNSAGTSSVRSFAIPLIMSAPAAIAEPAAAPAAAQATSAKKS
jgi:hypothetical protein